MGTALLVIGTIYFLAHFLASAYPRSRVPDVLGLVLFGVLLGPVTGLVPVESFGKSGPVLTTIALAVILFESGTSLSLETICASTRHTLLLTLTTTVATAAVITIGAAMWADLGWLPAALLGVIASGTSSAVVIPMLASLRTGPAATTVLTLESAITDVLSIVGTFALLKAATAGDLHAGTVLGGVVAAFGVASVLGIGAGIAWLKVWKYIRAIPNAMFTTPALGFVVYGLAEVLGFSGAIAVLAFGITLANSQWLERWAPFRDQKPEGVTGPEKAFFAEMVFLLKTFFFVYLGISIQFHSIAHTAMVATVLLAVFLLRLLISRWTLGEWELRDRQVASFMIPKGLAAAVLAGMPLQLGIVGGEVIRDWAYQLVFVSIVITAIVGALTDVAAVRRLYARMLERETRARDAGKVIKPPHSPA